MTRLLHNRPMALGTGFFLLALVGIVDYMVGREVTFSLFYLAPIALVTWVFGMRAGMLVSLAAAGFWVFVDSSHGPYSRAYVPYLNFSIRVSVFAIVVWLLDALKREIEKEKDLARIDYLTGAASLRAYYELLEMEIARSRRYKHPFTIAYIDLDNFKEVNDNFGHAAGDDTLRSVVASLKEGMRETDIVARLGGDEFALLLPEMEENEAKMVFPKLREGLLQEMKRHRWPVTFSIGVLVCEGAVFDAKHLVDMADELMYSIKKSGKNAIGYSAVKGE